MGRQVSLLGGWWLVDWLVDWLAGWLNGSMLQLVRVDWIVGLTSGWVGLVVWLVGCVVGWLVGWWAVGLVVWLVGCVVGWMVGRLDQVHCRPVMNRPFRTRSSPQPVIIAQSCTVRYVQAQAVSQPSRHPASCYSHPAIQPLSLLPPSHEPFHTHTVHRPVQLPA